MGGAKQAGQIAGISIGHAIILRGDTTTQALNYSITPGDRCAFIEYGGTWRFRQIQETSNQIRFEITPTAVNIPTSLTVTGAATVGGLTSTGGLLGSSVVLSTATTLTSAVYGGRVQVLKGGGPSHSRRWLPVPASYSIYMGQ